VICIVYTCENMSYGNIVTLSLKHVKLQYRIIYIMLIMSDTTLFYCRCYSIIVVTCFDSKMSSSDHTYISHMRNVHVEECYK
jgi:hypothetical protein